MVEFGDKKKIETWLEGRPHEEAFVLAARIALRVAPTENTGDPILTLAMMRAALVTLTASIWPTGDLQTASRLASRAVISASIVGPGSEVHPAAYSAARAAFAASANTSGVTDTGSSVAGAVATAVSSANSFIGDSTIALHAAADATLLEQAGSAADLMSAPLWLKGEPEWFSEAWSAFRDVLRADPAYAFWLRWYQQMLDGNVGNWEMLREITLIEPAIWDAGLEAVAAEIARIEAQFLAKAAPLAERIELDDSGTRVRAVPVVVDPPSLLETILQRMADSLDDALAAGNGLSERDAEARIILRLLDKYRADPQRVEMDLMSVGQKLSLRLQSGELPDDTAHQLLTEAAITGALDIRAGNDEIRRHRSARTAVIAGELTDRERAILLDEVLPVLRELSIPELGDQFAEDMKVLVGAPDEEGRIVDPKSEEAADSYIRLASRAARIRLLEGLNKALARVKDNPVYQAVDIGAKLNFLIELLTGIAGFFG